MTSDEKSLKTIIESLEDGYYEVDLAGNFVGFNQDMCDILGYTSDELTGLNNRAFMDKKNAKKMFHVFNQVFQSRKGCKTFDWKFLRKDGSVCRVDISVSFLTGPDSKPIGFHGIVRDMTQLQQSPKLETIGTLAPGISHDLNNILSGIFGYAQLAKTSLNNSQKASEYIDHVLTAAQRAAELVQQVLTSSRGAGDQKKPASEESTPAVSENRPQSSKKTIMLVDDEKAIRQIYEEFLTGHGYEVKLFENGAAALNAFEADPKGVDLVITDMTMPELTGDKLSEKILEIRPDMPIFLWCGFSEDISEDTAIQMGIKKYIQKPISPRDLLQSILRIFDEN